MSSEENPADTCPSCGEPVDIEEDEIIKFSYNLDGEHNSQVVHKKCFFEDTKQEVEEK